MVPIAHHSTSPELRMPSNKDIAHLLSGFPSDGPAAKLNQLLAHRVDQLPLPGQGHTLDRWRAFAAVGSYDLGLAKLFEGHTDALAILAELGAPTVAIEGRWGVWCADPPDSHVQARPSGAQTLYGPGAAVQLHGRKAWCSGAADIEQALVSAWLPDRQRCLVAVRMQQSGIRVDTDRWRAVGMAASASYDVHFNDVAGVLVGAPGEYLSRPGFYHGGAGVAACWYGAAVRIASALQHKHTLGRDPHGQVHLGAIDVVLAGARQLLREAAECIDTDPASPCFPAVQRARLAVETAVEEVLRRVPRALGPGPLCMERDLACMVADLPVFVRQSHAEHDQAALGRYVAEADGEHLWSL